jgi:hypothetical protein
LDAAQVQLGPEALTLAVHLTSEGHRRSARLTKRALVDDWLTTAVFRFNYFETKLDAFPHFL